MKSVITILITLSLLLATCAGSFTSTAQQPNTIQDPLEAGKGFTLKMHPSAVIGSTSERKAAWEALTTEQKATVLEKLRTIIENLKQEAIAQKRQEQRTDVDSTLAFTNDNGQRLLVTANAREVSKSNVETESSQAPVTCFDCEPCPECEPNPCLINPSLCDPHPSPTPTPTPTPTLSDIRGGKDADEDGLPQSFENAVADAFTPFYHVSAGERSGTGFATFENFVPQTVQQVFGSVPPISNFRVKPAGFRTDANGNQWGFLQLDYLTLWNRDDGISTGGICEVSLSIALGLAGYSLSQILPSLTDHALDNERSAVLIGAPVSGPNQYNLTPQAYKAYIFFTAAHEDTFLMDQSRIIFPSQPVPAGHHIELTFSHSKHGTYHFNPDYLPIFWSYVIYATYVTIEFFYQYGHINYFEYLAFMFAADIAFFACAIERFHEQGGAFAVTRTNVGELTMPLNNSNFIRDTKLKRKLEKMFIF